jgi:hypothetical protein
MLLRKHSDLNFKLALSPFLETNNLDESKSIEQLNSALHRSQDYVRPTTGERT